MVTESTKNASGHRTGLLRFFDEKLFSFLLVLGLLVLLVLAVMRIDTAIRSWNERDLNRRADLVASALSGQIASMSAPELQSAFQRITRESRMAGLILCRGQETFRVGKGAAALDCDSARLRGVLAVKGKSSKWEDGDDVIHATRHQVGNGGTLFILQDRGVITLRRTWLLRSSLAGGMLILAVVGLIAYIGARITRLHMRERLHHLVRLVLAGKKHDHLHSELDGVAASLNAGVARIRAENSTPEPIEGAEMLKALVHSRMPDVPLVLVANREPYIHVRNEDGTVRVDRPASGLVTGVEPLLRACGGVWLAHGSGDADRENSDGEGRLRVPPEHPEYALRRMWLTEEEESGFYFGFSNEGLWPLCHIAHTRPIFRRDDWASYQSVNQRFARAAAEEAGSKGMVLVQDYHFALLPLELRKREPNTVISIFWHIPWPNHEVVGICPWTKELLEGMLGADIIGFHTRYHCLNFLDTVQRYLECRVDLEHMAVDYKQRRTLVRPYPISVEWPYPALERSEGAVLRQELGIADDVHVVVGIDRADYTKGLLERVAGIEALLEDHPELIGKFVFVQLAAPSRTRIKLYRDLVTDLEEAVAAVNERYAEISAVAPIRLQVRSFSPDEVRRYYAMANTALVTPLHDGMNLVAKEYVAATSDDDGALVLSIFAGAAKELDGALLVNPYDESDIARAVYAAITMSRDERAERMRSMRDAIRKNSIFHWSASILADMAEIWEKGSSDWRRRDSEDSA